MQEQAGEGYAVRADGLPAGSLRAANPSQSFDATFGGSGVRIATGGRRDAALELTLASVSVGGRTVQARPGWWQTSGARVERSVSGGDPDVPVIREWYVNGPLGLEQGFTLNGPAQQSTCQPAPVPCVIEVALSLSGPWTPSLAANEGAIEFNDATSSATLRYGHLYAWDGAHRTLPARLAIRNDTVVIQVDAASAEYPVTIDPLLQKQKLTASDGAADDLFGTSVSISGDTAIVGAYKAHVGNYSDQGAAYVFVRSGGTWTQQAKLVPSDGASDDWFGYAVIVVGDTALVGAPYDDLPAANTGAVYMFTRSSTTWTEQGKISPGDAAVGGQKFGFSLALSASTLVVGAIGWS